MIRAMLIISGDVQGAGYRGIIIRTGRKLGLVGNVENIPDGTVKVVCEGEKEKIEELIKSIKIRDEIVDVENIDVKFEDASGEFDGKGFDVKASEKISDLYREMFHGYITSEKYFRVGFKKQDKMLDKQDQMLEKQDEMIGKQDETISAIKGLDKKQDTTIDVLKDFRDYTKQSFTDMGNRYGSIQNELVNTRKELAKLVEHIGVLVEEHIKRE
ncbi:MAG: acylphosphatase [Thermoplasmatales archaeon]|nr:acylphosphatase [Thermoplasmatales archaeon]